MSRRLIFSLVLIGLILFVMTSLGYCANVTDNNKGTKGEILINNGTGQGHQGTWTDPNSLGFAASDDLNKEIDNRISGDKNLQTQVDSEVTDRKSGDTQLQSNINNEVTTRLNADNLLGTRIDTSNVAINNNTKTIQNHEQRLNDVEHRVGKLEQTNYKIQTEFRVIDTKRISVSPYISNNITRSKIDEVGVRVTIKVGSSYEEREINKTNARLDRIEALMALPEVQESLEQARINKIEVEPYGNGFRVKRGF